VNRSNQTAVILLFASLAGLLAILLWWRTRRSIEEEIILTTEDGVISRFRVVERSRLGAGQPPPSRSRSVPPTPAGEPTSPPPDDLEKIWGIGPKTANVLRAAGIASFAQLASTEVERLQEILGEAGYRLGNPETWPRQARLAAGGNWDELAALQEELRRQRKSS
jgi:predicted flap endonuclease-1-like 5' DNA nuclease